jgi:hypothetical protein
MNFITPFGFLFAIFIPAVILLYLLKLKRIDTIISSTLLWRRTLEDMKANTPFQKLKRNLLLFLQLLIISLLVLSIARPVLNLGGLQGQSFIVLIDQSASMSATDVKPNRLEAAKRKAIEIVNDMSIGDQMMVVTFAAGARPISTFKQNKGVLRSVIRGISPTGSPTRVAEALQIARAAAEVQPNAEIIIISDGGFTIPSDSPLSSLKTRFVPIGDSENNVGIVDLVVRKDLGIQQNSQILVGVQNSSQESKEIYLELWGKPLESGEINDSSAPVSAGNVATNEKESVSSMERKRIDARKIAIGPKSRETIIFKDVLLFPKTIEVFLDSDDDLQIDNEGWILIPPQKTIRMLLVTEGNYFLQRVLNIDSRCRVSVVSLAEYTGPQDFDLVVFDAYSPPTLIAGNYLFINAIPPLPEWTSGEEIVLPAIIDWNRFHPMTRYLTLDNLTINKCKNIGIPAWAEVIAEARETPLIATFQENEIRGVVTAFDIYDSDWPLRVSFPIFFANINNWCIQNVGPSSLIKRTGDIISLDPPENLTDELIIKSPDASQQWSYTFSDNSPQFFSETQQTGIYDIVVGETMVKQYSVNLLSVDETDISPKKILQAEEFEIQGDMAAVSSNREIWRILAIIALLVLFIEWWVYVRRARYAF